MCVCVCVCVCTSSYRLASLPLDGGCPTFAQRDQSVSDTELGSAPVLELLDPSCRNYLTKLQAQLSPQKTAVVRTPL